MTPNEILQRLESNKVILINTEEETHQTQLETQETHTCIKCTKEKYNNIVLLTNDSALIEFREKLDQLEVEMHLLETENEMLRRQKM